MLKSTYGTGCFALLNTGADMVRSKNRLLTTIAYRLDGETTYALEGSIFIAGAAVQWLRDGLGDHRQARRETGELADRADPTQEVYLVPAFTGLGAPHWDPKARGAIYGLTRNTRPGGIRPRGTGGRLLPDPRPAGGDAQGLEERRRRARCCASTAAWSPPTGRCSGFADLLEAPVDRPAILETTALGAAWLAGSRAGRVAGPEGLSRDLEARPALRADDGREDARRQASRAGGTR